MEADRINKDVELMNVFEVAEFIKVHPRTIKKWVKQGEFPQHIRISQNRSVFVKSEIIDWLNSKI